MSQERRERMDKSFDRRDRQQGRWRGGDIEVDWLEREADRQKGRRDRTEKHGRKRR